jgi:hypothetical protein
MSEPVFDATEHVERRLENARERVQRGNFAEAGVWIGMAQAILHNVVNAKRRNELKKALDKLEDEAVRDENKRKARLEELEARLAKARKPKARKP